MPRSVSFRSEHFPAFWLAPDLSRSFSASFLWWAGGISPGIAFRVGGEENGSPISLPLSGKIPFAVLTSSSKTLELQEVRVSFDPKSVDLTKTEGSTPILTVDDKFPAAMVFTTKRELVAGLLLGNYLNYAAKQPRFEIKISAVVQARQEDLPFWAKVFGSNTARSEKIFHFKDASDTRFDVSKLGILIRAKEKMNMEGGQSQAELDCVAPNGPTTVDVLEILKDKAVSGRSVPLP